MTPTTVFSCPAARASVRARDAAGVWHSLGETEAGPVSIPANAPEWLVVAREPDDAALAALAAAVEAAGAPGLVVSCGRLTRDGLRAVRGLSELRRFGLRAVRSFAVDGVRDPYLTSRELGYLYGMTGLEELSLEGGRLRMGSVIKLARRMPALRRLTLSGCFQHDGDAARLADLDALRELTIHGPSEYGEHPDWLTDAGLRALARLRRLEALDLWRCKQISDAGVAALAGHPTLQALTVGDPDHTYHPGPAALAALGALPALRRLALHGCGRAWPLETLAPLARPPLSAFQLEACHVTPAARDWLSARFPGASLRPSQPGTTLHLRWPGEPLGPTPGGG